MKQNVYDALKQLARNEKICTYGQLNHECGLCLDWSGDTDRVKIGKILGDISKNEVNHKRPMISVLVISKETVMPSDGFFNLATELGIKKTHQSRIRFRASETKKVFEYWKNK